MREEAKAKGEIEKYNGLWRERTDYPEDKPYAIRFKNPLDGNVVIKDMVKGDITISNEQLDDLIHCAFRWHTNIQPYCCG